MWNIKIKNKLFKQFRTWVTRIKQITNKNDTFITNP